MRALPKGQVLGSCISSDQWHTASGKKNMKGCFTRSFPQQWVTTGDSPFPPLQTQSRCKQSSGSSAKAVAWYTAWLQHLQTWGTPWVSLFALFF